MIPFCFFLAGDAFTSLLKQSLSKKRPYVTKLGKLFIVTFFIVSSVLSFATNMQYFRRTWQLCYYLSDKPAHSFAFYNEHSAPLYTMTHKHRPLVRLFDLNPTFQRRAHGIPVPISAATVRNMCYQMMDSFQREEIRPEYIIMIPFDIRDRLSVSENVCLKLIERYYDVEETMVFQDWFKWTTTAINVYRLKQQYSPI